ncbi:WecB/TagA/CpsF family glycosyltransferase [Williamsia sp.]|uniref:WecB/TagA/CpsF family glycosyltransferase n=1 Tax=Williamsia sp. TaxID=1872085 RepID=UPI001A2C9CFF|nr:WecB/TagA/CpsF family glycosyltransferase [Williamsia sp.]MBJ7289898.1 WecB/TagA/CpsF family glycosyltransferase [Williamsia sp.]
MVGAIPFEVTDLRCACDQVLDYAANRIPIAVRLGNAFTIASAASDPQYMRLLAHGGVNFPDGAPVVWAMNRNLPRRAKGSRVRGPSLFADVLDKGRSQGIRHGFIGTTQQTLDNLVKVSHIRYPGLRVGATYAPPFAKSHNALIESITSAIDLLECDLVWIALGTPKQDFVAEQIAKISGRPCVGIGAAFDFAAGQVKEAPKIIQSTGLEWLYRLSQDPKRLWKRYTVGNIAFARQVLISRKIDRSDEI